MASHLPFNNRGMFYPAIDPQGHGEPSVLLSVLEKTYPLAY